MAALSGRLLTLRVADFTEWRATARRLIAADVAPPQISWADERSQQSLLWDESAEAQLPEPQHTALFKVPKAFVGLAQQVACHRDPARWHLLYTALWRLCHGEPHLLQLMTDDLVHRLLQMEKAVRRDAHKMKAFVRFKRCVIEDEEWYIAWHRPDHDIVRLIAPFFRKRFSVMRWAIMTPYRSMHWDGERLRFSGGIAAASMPEDGLEALWLSYYRATFNPARIKIKAMVKEMPVRHWPTLPETRMIPQLLAEAPQRVERMVRQNQQFDLTAAAFIPTAAGLTTLAAAAPACRGCELYRCAGRTVFGEGPADARIMLIGEQPGDEEDRAGRPFAGPAGRLLDQLLSEAGLERSALYLTNAVKHFKFSERNGRRIHRSPSMGDIQACRPWLEAEIAALKPQRILALGVSAARALLGAGSTLQELRGDWHRSEQVAHAAAIRVSYHPAAILRTVDESQRTERYQALLSDLRQLKSSPNSSMSD